MNEEALYRLAARSAAAHSDGDPYLREELTQEAWIRAWQAPKGKPEAYYQKVITNRINACMRWGTRLGSERPHSGGGGPLLIQERPLVLEYLLLALQTTKLSHTPNFPSEVAWAYSVVENEAERQMVDDLVEGRVSVSNRYGMRPESGGATWGSLRNKLAKAWKELDKE